MSLVARTGRHRQRYDTHFRLVAGCIPYRLRPCEEEHTANLLDRLEVLMISSPDRQDLVFPKGGWETDESVADAACREALEEAGIKGNIHEKSLGFWDFRSKSSERSRSPGGFVRCYVFALEVTEELDSWPEQACHQRRWVSIQYDTMLASPRLFISPLPVPDAWGLCRYPWMREALKEFLRTQGATLMTFASSDSPPPCGGAYAKPPEPERIDSALNNSLWSFLLTHSTPIGSLRDSH